MKRRCVYAGIFWLLLLCALALLYICTLSGWVLAAVLFVLLGQPASFLWNLAARKHIQLRLELPSSAGKGDRVPGAVSARFGFPGPAGRVWCVMNMRNDLTGEEETVELPLRQDGRGAKRSFTTDTFRCGRMKAEIQNLYLTDLLGVFRVSCPLTAQANMTVMPDMVTAYIPGELAGIARQDSETTMDSHKGNDRSEMYQLRDYVPGDDPRSIHRKLSSKLDKLVYREPGAPTDRSVLLCWDQYSGTPEELDVLAEAVFSIGQSLCENGFSYQLGWNDQGELRQAQINGQDSLLMNLPSLLRRNAPAPLETESFSGYGTVLLFTAEPPENISRENIRLFCCGDASAQAVCLRPDNYRELLQSPEIWL